MTKWVLLGIIMSLGGGATALQAGGISIREIMDNSSALGSASLGATFREQAVFIQTVPGQDDLICIPVPKPKPKPQPEQE